VDVIYVATPHGFHRDHTLLCLQHKKAVLCEKAFAMNHRQAKEMVALAQTKKVFLMEAMANHGDSLTVVKPGEYVNLVIIDGGTHWFGDDSGDRAQREILSVQKSVITDYKTGKLTLDAFKQKVLNYAN